MSSASGHGSGRPFERNPALPQPPGSPDPAAFPVVAALAPVVVSLAIWAITHSVFALLFAALGPIVALASMADSRMNRRRTMRRQRRDFFADVDATRTAIERAHDAERTALAALDPPIVTLLAAEFPRTGWRSPSTDGVVLVSIGRGPVQSSIVLEGARPSGIARDVAIGSAIDSLVRSAETLADAPVVVDLSRGVAVQGPLATARALVRALVARALLAIDPTTSLIVAPSAAEWVWLEGAPHPVERRDTDSTGLEIVTIHSSPGSDLTRPTQVGMAGDAARSLLARIVIVHPGAVAPVDCPIAVSFDTGTATWALVEGDRARTRPIEPDFVTATDAARFAAVVARVSRLGAGDGEVASAPLPDRVDFAELPAASRGDAGDAAARLDCPLGVRESGVWSLDLVRDGPHAVIGGTTGSGKSELLISWIVSLAARYPPNELNFLLVDFKGGASFAAVRGLAHSVGVLTDLEPASARRALESLRAEISYRERILASRGVRSIDEWGRGTSPSDGVGLARLVIVIDEFAALASDLPQLHALIADIASRGRSLGMHLILCTQRPAEALRDRILANCTLRICLRVNDRADSAALVSSSVAASFTRERVGRAAVVVAGEPAFVAQVAMTGVDDIAGALRETADASTTRRPWLDPLAPTIERATSPRPAGEPCFGMTDRPADQSQGLAVWNPQRDGHVVVHGARGAGRSMAIAALLRGIAEWSPSTLVVRVAGGIEAAWDAVTEASEWATDHAVSAGETLCRMVLAIDDLDALVARFGQDHAGEFVDRLGRLLREGPGRGIFVVASVQRADAAVHRVLSLCDSRLVLRMTSRQEHTLVGGVADHFDEAMPPGGGYWRGDRVQVFLEPAAPPGRASSTPAVDLADFPLVAIVSSSPNATIGRLSAGSGEVVDLRGDPTAIERATQLPSSGAAPVTESTAASPRVIVGDVDAWLSAPRLLDLCRSGALIILEGCSVSEYRSITRSRAVPPPIEPGSANVWLVEPERMVRRATLAPARA